MPLNIEEDLIERDKMFHTLEALAEEPWPESTLDLEVFMLPDYHLIPPEIEEAGGLTSPARFSFFIPKKLIKQTGHFKKKFYPYTILQREESENWDLFQKFIVDSEVHKMLLQYTSKKCSNRAYCDDDGMYRPAQCANTTKCAALLTSNYEDMRFVVEHIQELNLSVNVYWLDRNLKHVVKILLELYFTDAGYMKKSSNFLVLHWRPSEIIDGSIEFIPMQMPMCEELATRNRTGCKYEMIPLLKYYSAELKSGPAKMAQQSLLKYVFSQNALKSLIMLYESFEDELNWPELSQAGQMEIDVKVNEVYNTIACEWLKKYPSFENSWKPQKGPKENIYIGGIFPFNVPGSNYKGIIVLSYCFDWYE